MASLHSIVLVMGLWWSSWQRYEFTEIHMAMPVTIVMYAPNEMSARRAAGAAFAELALLEGILSDYRAQSDVRELERNAGTWAQAAAPLVEVVGRSIQMHRLTRGAFDPTVGSATRLWRAARQAGAPPTTGQLDSVLAQIGIENVQVDTIGGRMRLSPGTALDFGGIAKGYMLQRALDVLRARGISRVLVAAGGDIVIGDRPPDGSSWRVAFPEDVMAQLEHRATFANVAVATSGSSAQGLNHEGVRHSHVVDPRTARAVTTVCTTYVMAREAWFADALATAWALLDTGNRRRISTERPDVLIHEQCPTGT